MRLAGSNARVWQRSPVQAARHWPRDEDSHKKREREREKVHLTDAVFANAVETAVEGSVTGPSRWARLRWGGG